MTTLDSMTRPEFAVVVRGYDRAQVDDYLARLHEWLTDSETRRSAAEEARNAARRELSEVRARLAMIEERSGAATPESMAAFGERLGQILQEAITAADELRSRAKAEAESQRAALAEERKAMQARNRAEADRLIEQARRKEEEINAHIADLGAKRAGALGELSRLQQHLADLLSGPEPLPVTRGGPAGTSGGAEDEGPGRAAPQQRREVGAPATSPTLVQPAQPSGGAQRPASPGTDQKVAARPS